AWSVAMRQVCAENSAFDAIHFVTSAFNTLYTEYLNHFQPAMLSYVLSLGTCLGHIDSYPHPVRLRENLSQSWIRTCFFFLPTSIACSISPWVAFADPAHFF